MWLDESDRFGVVGDRCVKLVGSESQSRIPGGGKAALRSLLKLGINRSCVRERLEREVWAKDLVLLGTERHADQQVLS